MSEPYIGTICYFAFPFAPKGWAMCNGQVLPISSNQALFSLLGTTYGGDGIRTFQLPNLQGLATLGVSGSAYPLGAIGGEEKHKLSLAEIPQHVHLVKVDSNTSASANSPTPGVTTVLGNSGLYTAPPTPVSAYSTASPSAVMAQPTIGNAGMDQPHENRMPFLVMNACIALMGIFPSRN